MLVQGALSESLIASGCVCVTRIGQLPCASVLACMLSLYCCGVVLRYHARVEWGWVTVLLSVLTWCRFLLLWLVCVALYGDRVD